MTSIKVLIPARGGSVRVPGKNVRMLGKYPLLVWSILTGLEIGETYVSTDSREYGEIAFRYGAKVVYREGVTDAQGDLEVVRHFLGLVPCDVVVYLRPTTPFREVSVVKAALAGFEGSGLRSVEEMGESAYKCFMVYQGRLCAVENNDRDLTDKPNHLCPKTYHPNGYVDLIRAEWVKKDSLWGPEKQAFITKPVIEIDTEEDFEYASYWIQRNPPAVYSFGYERLT